ncbi:MAG: Trm112 family protein [Desulfovibrionaceae bacterium]|nr:Trm112 family protein [Desulfovibrionaceae bacterium]
MCDPDFLQILACPVCRGHLALEGREPATALVCAGCSLVYPIQDGIPVLLKEEGVPLQSWQAGQGSAFSRGSSIAQSPFEIK